jgi:hypothetical protein
MKNINITIEDEVYFLCNPIIKERRLSPIINDFLKSLVQSQGNEFFQQKSELEREREVCQERMKEISSKLIIMQIQEDESRKKARQQTLQVLAGMRANNPLRGKI